MNSWRCGGSGGGGNSNPPPAVQPTAVPSVNTAPSSTTGGGSTSSLATREWWGTVNPPTSGEYVQVRESGLRIRQFPGTDQVVLGVTRQWDYYPLYETRGDWGLISGTYGSGWVHLAYVSVFSGARVEVVPSADATSSVPDGRYTYQILNVCSADPLIAWYIQEPADYLSFMMPNFPRVVNTIANLLDITQISIRAHESRVPDQVDVMFVRDVNTNLYYAISRWWQDGVEIRTQYWTYTSSTDDPCPEIRIAIQTMPSPG